MKCVFKTFTSLALASFFCVSLQSMQKELSQTAIVSKDQIQTQQGYAKQVQNTLVQRLQQAKTQSNAFSDNLAKVKQLCAEGKFETAEAIAAIYKGRQAEFEKVQRVIDQAKSDLQIQNDLVQLHKILPNNLAANRLRKNIAKVEELCAVGDFISAYRLVSIHKQIGEDDEATLLRAIIERYQYIDKKAELLKELEEIGCQCSNEASLVKLNWISNKNGKSISCYNLTAKECCLKAAAEDRDFVKDQLRMTEYSIGRAEETIRKAHLLIIDRYIAAHEESVDLKAIRRALQYRKETKGDSKTLPAPATDSNLCVSQGLMDFIEVRQDNTLEPKRETKTLKAVDLNGGIATVFYVKKSNTKTTNVDPNTGLAVETTYTPPFGPDNKAPITHFAAITHFSATDYNLHERCLQETVNGAVLNRHKIMDFKIFMFIPEDFATNEKQYFPLRPTIDRLTSKVKTIYPDAQIEMIPYKVVNSAGKEVTVTMEKKWEMGKNVDHIVLDYNLPGHYDQIRLH